METYTAAVSSPEEKTQESRSTILIAEDEVGPRESLKLVLGPSYNIVLAQNGEEGLEQFEKHTPDLVISDIRMPRMDGIEFMQELNERAPDVPFIILTGYGSLETAQKALRAGAFDYISKPYDVEEIRKMAAKAIASSREKKENEQTAEQLRSMNTQLEEEITKLSKKATIGDLSAQMVHDLKNPLFVLQGYINLLEEKIDEGNDPGEREEEREYVKTISEQVACCARLTKGFLHYAKDTSSERTPTNINEIVKDTLFLLHIRFRKANIELIEDLSENLPIISTQSSALQQVIYNLLINALQVMEDDAGGKITVETRNIPGEENDASVLIGVYDNGPGIPEKDRDKIFNSYFTTREDGTGLGLAVCKRIIDNHSGHIELETEEGAGTGFRIYLPLSSPDVDTM